MPEYPAKEDAGRMARGSMRNMSRPIALVRSLIRLIRLFLQGERSFSATALNHLLAGYYQTDRKNGSWVSPRRTAALCRFPTAQRPRRSHPRARGVRWVLTGPPPRAPAMSPEAARRPPVRRAAR